MIYLDTILDEITPKIVLAIIIAGDVFRKWSVNLRVLRADEFGVELGCPVAYDRIFDDLQKVLGNGYTLEITDNGSLKIGVK